MESRFRPGDKVAVITKGEYFGVILEQHETHYKVWGLNLDDDEFIHEDLIVHTQVQVPESWLAESVTNEEMNEAFDKGLIFDDKK